MSKSVSLAGSEKVSTAVVHERGDEKVGRCRNASNDSLGLLEIARGVSDAIRHVLTFLLPLRDSEL